MALPPVELEDGHVGDGAEEEEKEEDRGDGHIDLDGRDAAQAGSCGCVRSMLRDGRGGVLREIRMVGGGKKDKD